MLTLAAQPVEMRKFSLISMGAGNEGQRIPRAEMTHPDDWGWCPASRKGCIKPVLEHRNSF